MKGHELGKEHSRIRQNCPYFSKHLVPKAGRENLVQNRGRFLGLSGVPYPVGYTQDCPGKKCADRT